MKLMDINKTSHNFLHTFCIRPAFHFQTQADGEEVILVVRGHPITQIWWLINSVILLTVLLVADYFFSMLLNPFQSLFTYIFSFIMVGAYVWLNILIWFFNVGIITNKRVVDIDFQGVIYKEITEARLERIQDITVKAGGFAESFFNFGNIFIQTAGTEANIEYGDVPYPDTIIKIIHQLTEQKQNNQ